MDYAKLVKENEQLRQQLQKTTDNFNRFIMREKEFEDLRRETEFCRNQIVILKAKNQTAQASIKFLRTQLAKKERQLQAKKQQVELLRKMQTPNSSLNRSTTPTTF